jgi:hypothetical protein
MAVRKFVILRKHSRVRPAAGPRTGPARSRRTRRQYPALVGGVLVSLLSSLAAAQQPTPLFNTLPNNPPSTAAPPSEQSIPAQPLPPPSASPAPIAPGPVAPPAPTSSPDTAPPAPPPVPSRVFCEQSVAAQPVNPASVPERYRQFVGIFSDADWNPQTCAALIVENVAGDGTATITYVFGPLVTGGKASGGVLHGTGIVKDDALLFQNTDGSQYAFRPFYSDLDGKWTTPKGQTYEAIFKRAY